LALSSSQPHSQPNGFEYDNIQNMVENSGPEIEDPLPGASDKDRFGLKGLLAVLKGPYPDQAALITGMDVHSLGLDLNSNE
jgi:CCR4-NOT transcription complex subunit 2